MSHAAEDALDKISKVFLDKDMTLAVAESCTGGLLGHTITETPGCSKWFRGGVISYNNEVKETILGVFKETLKEYGAVSAETALEMACGVRLQLSSTVSIAITGVAGPDGGSPKKPVGLVFVALDFDEKTGKEPLVKELKLHGTRAEIKKQTVQAALSTLCEVFSPDN